MSVAPTRTLLAAALVAVSCSKAPPPPPSSPEVDPAYQASIDEWRQKREARLRAPDGWLAVAGLFWLDEGETKLGTAADNKIVLSDGPPLAGTLTRAGAQITLAPAPGVEMKTGGAPITAPVVLQPDSAGQPTEVTLGRLTFFIIDRDGQYGVRLKDPEAPARKDFKGLTWYPVAPGLVVLAHYETYATPRSIEVPNVLGRATPMKNPGKVVFSAGGKEVSLEALLEEDDAKELFFVFADGTTGKTTYGGGRFLYSPLTQDGLVTLDFNKAYSPPCAFTEFATCPLPPPGNKLAVAIEAGEKFAGHH